MLRGGGFDDKFNPVNVGETNKTEGVQGQGESLQMTRAKW